MSNEIRLALFGSNFDADLLEVADSKTSDMSGFLITVAKETEEGFILQGSLCMDDYIPECIIQKSERPKGEYKNEVSKTHVRYSVAMPFDCLDDQSIKTIRTYIKNITELFDYMDAVDRGEKEDKRFGGQWTFDDMFQLNPDGTLLNIVLRGNPGFGYPTLQVASGWLATEIEYRQDKTNPYHKIISFTISEDGEYKVVSNGGGTQTQVGTKDNVNSLIERRKAAVTKATSSGSTGASAEVPVVNRQRQQLKR